jgi:hypothetical protein
MVATSCEKSPPNNWESKAVETSVVEVLMITSPIHVVVNQYRQNRGDPIYGNDDEQKHPQYIFKLGICHVYEASIDLPDFLNDEIHAAFPLISF